MKKSHSTTRSKPKGTDTKAFFQRKAEGHFFSSSKIQSKLKTGKAQDKYEQQADQVADQVVDKQVQTKPAYDTITPLESNFGTPQKKEEDTAQMQENPLQKMSDTQDLQKQEEVQEKEDIQEKEDSVQEMYNSQSLQKQEEVQEKEEDSAQMSENQDLQKQEELQEKEEVVQGKNGAGQLSLSIENILNNAKGKGSPLPESFRQKMEASFGADFSVVRIHTGASAIVMNQQLKAQAFAHGRDIFFNQGKFDVNSKNGQQLLAHELTHTIQQGAVQKKTAEEGGIPTGNAGLITETSSSPDITSKTENTTTTTESIETPITTEALPENSVITPQQTTDATDMPVEGETTGEILAVPRSPEEDPNFQALQNRATETKKAQAAHQPAKGFAKNAGEAAPSPSNEKTSKAQTNQVGEMEAEEPKEFDAASFKKLLLDKIKEIMPKNEDEADDFKEDNRMTKVRDVAANKVGEEKQKAAGGIEEKTTTPPDTSTIPDRETKELIQPKAGRKPKSLAANTAMPPVRPNTEINAPLEKNAQEVEDQMTTNQITEEQLAKSEEPAFTTALADKKTAQEHSQSAPMAFRQEEQGTLTEAQQQSETKSQEQVADMFSDRNKLFKAAGGQQQNTSKDNTTERDRIAKEIDGIYQKTKTEVESKLNKLDEEVPKLFDKANTTAKKRFENYVDYKMAVYKEERYSGFGAFKRVGDFFTGLPDEVNAFFVQGRERYIADMNVALTYIATHIANGLKAAKTRIETGKKEVHDYVDKLPKNLKKFGEEAADAIQDKFAELADAVDSKQDELIDTLAESYKESLGEVDAQIEEMKEANKGLIDKAKEAIDGVVETIKKLREMISDLMASIKSVIGVIMADPIGFMKDLFGGIGQGIDNFSANVKKHLIGGLLKWLTGALGPMGIQVPENIFSLSGIFDLVMQILGLGWDFVRRKAVKLMGEPVVNALEKGFEMFKLMKEKGIAGIWEYLKEQFTDLKATVMDAIQDMLITKVIEGGIKWIVSLLIPGAGFIKAAMAIKDFIVFFVESAMMLIPALTKAIQAAATRNFGNIAKAIENGIALLIPLVIGLFAKLINLGSVTKKVQEIIKKIRKRIDRAINKLIFKAKKFGKKLLGKGKKRTRGNKDKDKDKDTIELTNNQKEKAFLDATKELDTNLKDGISYKEAINISKKFKTKYKFHKISVTGGQETLNIKAGFSPEKNLTKAQRLEVNKAKKLVKKKYPNSLKIVHVTIIKLANQKIGDFFDRAQKGQIKGIIKKGLKESGRPFSNNDVKKIIDRLYASSVHVVSPTKELRTVYKTVYKNTFRKAIGDVHHIIPLYLKGSHESINLIELTKEIHDEIHSIFSAATNKDGFSLNPTSLNSKFATKKKHGLAVIFKDGKIKYEIIKFTK